MFCIIADGVIGRRVPNGGKDEYRDNKRRRKRRLSPALLCCPKSPFTRAEKVSPKKLQLRAAGEASCRRRADQIETGLEISIR